MAMVAFGRQILVWLSRDKWLLHSPRQYYWDSFVSKKQKITTLQYKIKYALKNYTRYWIQTICFKKILDGWQYVLLSIKVS